MIRLFTHGADPGLASGRSQGQTGGDRPPAQTPDSHPWLSFVLGLMGRSGRPLQGPWHALRALWKGGSTPEQEPPGPPRPPGPPDPELPSLRERYQSLQVIMEAIPAPIFYKDTQGRYLGCNRAFEEFMGLERDQFLGRTAFDLDAQELARLYAAKDREVLSQGGRHEYQAEVEKEGLQRKVVISKTMLPDAQGRPAGVVGVIFDITERERAEAGLKKSEQRYRELLESISDQVYTQDLEGRFTSSNQALNNIMGYSTQELIGRKASEFMKPELREAFVTEYLAKLRTQGHHSGVSVYYHRDGSHRYLEYRSQLVTPPDGEPYISGVARDVTERFVKDRELKKLQRQLAQAQKMEALGTLAGGVAHDFNNLLGAVMGYADLAIHLAEENQDNRRHLGSIIQAAERARNLVRQILTFSRKLETRPRPMDLNREVRQAAQLLERALPKMIAVHLDLAQDLKVINGDPSQIEQVLINLGANAGDAMPGGGRLTIATRNLVLDESASRQRLGVEPGEYVELSVADTGCGMDPHVISHIFDPFFTTKEVGRGTGLGLSTAYGIVKNHHGHIECTSRPGQGTVFRILLPVAESEAGEPIPEPAPGQVVRGGDETILLVDDEEMLREMGREVLENRGYRVLEARSGEEALSIYREKAAAIHLVILDLGMPGMGGERCLVQLMAADPQVKVLVASGYTQDEQVRRVNGLGAAGFLGKPFRESQLAAEVRRVLDSAAGA